MDIVVKPWKEAVREFERKYLLDAIAQAGGNRDRAAELVGRNRTDFRRRMVALGIPRLRPKARYGKAADAAHWARFGL